MFVGFVLLFFGWGGGGLVPVARAGTLSRNPRCVVFAIRFLGGLSAEEDTEDAVASGAACMCAVWRHGAMRHKWIASLELV